MQAGTAQVVDLQAYRERRAAASRVEPDRSARHAGTQVPVVLYPMWLLVPVIMVPN
jgi:hypothetical protein